MTMNPTPYAALPPHESDLDRIDGALADLGCIVRRAACGTLEEPDFIGLVGRIRERLKALRGALQVEADVAEALIDAAQAKTLAGRVGRDPALRELIRRNPGLMTARQLASNPGVRRARLYGRLAVVDGDRP